MNSSLPSGCFPSSFKKAYITPRLKKPTLDPSTIQNYRPVSIEKPLNVLPLTNSLPQNNLLDLHQSCFRLGHSTETALLAVKESLQTAQAASLSSVLILLYLSAAFDIINHSSLLSSLAATGILIKSYLSGRSSQVTCAGNVSTPCYWSPSGLSPRSPPLLYVHLVPWSCHLRAWHVLPLLC